MLAADHPPDEGGILRSSYAADCSLVTSDVNGGEDLISRLPYKLLSDVVARLPLKDAARTAVLSQRWRRIWASTPLVLDDADLLPVLSDGGGFVGADWRDITDAVSCILATHPGPFLSVRLTGSFHYLVAHDIKLASYWLRVLADKTVEKLELLNLPGATSASLPCEVFCIASLRRIYFGHWDFPSTDVLCRGTAIFPNLRQLWLRQMRMGGADFDRLLLFSPALEIFALISSHSTPPHVRIRSRNLQCAISWMSVVSQLQVLVAPKLNRLILWSKNPDGRLVHGSRTKVNISYAPELRVLGYLDPRYHMLEIGTTQIEAEIKPNLSAMVPSVQILALNVRFDVSREAQMVPSFLRCFPFIDTLHVQSDGVGESTSELNDKFWLEGSPIRCLQSTLTKVVFKNFRGHDTELTFLRFIWERAKMLKKLVVDFAGRDDPAVLKQVVNKMKSRVLANRVFPGRKSSLMLRTKGCNKWSLRVASDLALSDPFDF